MKLDQDDVIRIYQRVVDHGMDTKFVARQIGISRRWVGSRSPSTHLISWTVNPDGPSYDGQGAVAVAQIFCAHDGITINHNRVPAIPKEHVTEDPNQQGRRRPWA